MRTFEQLLGWSPDGGSGFLELLVLIIPVILGMCLRFLSDRRKPIRSMIRTL